jgi:predicted ribonuclease YlaK
MGGNLRLVRGIGIVDRGAHEIAVVVGSQARTGKVILALATGLASTNDE